MVRKSSVKNDYQKYILSQLRTSQFARFSDIKPENINSNSFSYHLKELLKGGWITKSAQGYSLGPSGLAHAARDTEEKTVRMQPNLMIALLIQDPEGNVLLHKKSEQPYIATWELPSVPAAVADTSIRDAAEWAARKLLHITPDNPRHAGDCYVRVHRGKVALTATMFHIIRFAVGAYEAPTNFMWVDPLKIAALSHAPALDQIVARAFFNDPYFFEEYTVQYSIQAPLVAE